jgi:hypothetical protein
MTATLAISLLLVLASTGAAWGWARVRRRHMQLWLGAFVKQEVKRFTGPARRAPIDVLLCIADHFEPAPGREGGRAVDEWINEYPHRFRDFRDCDGRGPRHTFFYPIDEYQEHHVDALAGLCSLGHGEVELHLHHDNDTAENLEATLRRWTCLLVSRHGLLGRWRDGRPAYGFVHGNWALNNSRPDGRFCGVCDELSVLARTGCYADFTLPSAPSPTQTKIINSIYYARSHPGQKCQKPHDTGVPVGSGEAPDGGLMLIQGPLRLYRQGLAPRVENACIQASQPPTMERLDRWLKCRVGVAGRPDLVFIKLHTHGAKAANRQVLLGDAMIDFHRGLSERAASDSSFRYHYVTAREMYNLAKAAEAGTSASVADVLDFAISPPGPDNTPDSSHEPAKCAAVSPQAGR